ncbi:L-carnitine dehydrogenase [Streptomyces sp. MBT84]|uniref:3-hydroxyacyl-CoA dehydrogenase NAD-binding domain-containing protein n=1 Tax=unclassified Streptomyces TaxID=2593676 RepID=UPI001C6E7F05|nr:3-hydroxyacyl-CoA dehydrogenase NAD-binding domain-containing protein [Streptomyces sp. MBT84]MBW8706905.1 L-carnitine dehydrogenase [Streptomyces sp. MBT84]
MPVVAIVGAGVIGLSWSRLFAEHGWEVRISDPRPDLRDLVAQHLAGYEVAVTPDLAAALEGADYVQEAGPERIEIKRRLYAAFVAHTRPDVVLASSSSSLLPSAIAEGNPAADRILIGHPFNPPELMPLVEVVPSPATSAFAIERAVDVYQGLDKLPITLKKEIPGFVGNRLQKVFADQATYLVQEGVITAADLDGLVKASLGLRWATIGPFESRHLGGGPGGIRHVIAHIGSQMTFDVGTPDPTKTDQVIAQVEETYGAGPQAYEQLAARRDRRTRAVSAALTASDAATEEATD